MSSKEHQDASIRQVLAEHGRLAAQASSIARDAELSAHGLTSHATVNVMLALEEHFGIEFPDQMLTRGVFTSVATIQAAVEKLVDVG